jgi:hypothetical protein
MLLKDTNGKYVFGFMEYDGDFLVYVINSSNQYYEAKIEGKDLIKRLGLITEPLDEDSKTTLTIVDGNGGEIDGGDPISNCINVKVTLSVQKLSQDLGGCDAAAAVIILNEFKLDIKEKNLTLVLSHIDDVAERRRKEIKLSSDHYNELTGINQQLTTELTAITKRNENVRSDLVKAYLPMVNSKKRRIEELTHEVSSLKKTVQFNEGDGFSDDSDGR